jgi:hypothetical protein
MPRAMLRAMRRKSHPASLQPTNTATWLVVRDSMTRLVESTHLAPGADLRTFVIISVLASKGAGVGGQNQDGRVLIPFTTAMKRITGDRKSPTPSTR